MMSGSLSLAHRVTFTGAVVVFGAALAGCQGGGDVRSTTAASPSTGGATQSAAATTGTSAPSSQADPADLSLVTSIADKAEDVRPDTPLTVTAKNGELTSVTVTSAKGKTLSGKLEGGAWTATSKPALSTGYTVSAKAKGTDGQEQTLTSTFTTLTPKVQATYRVVPDGATVGVGMPVQVLFDSPVKTVEQRAAIEKALTIKMTPVQTGSWGWSDSTRLYWRPKAYWTPGTKVEVNAPLAGLQTGTDKWITQDKGATFSIGRSRISYINLKTHRMVVKESGKVVADYPISAGKPGAKTTTRSGIKVITEKHPSYTMSSASYGVKEGDPDYYKEEVQYAMRITNTGEFLHSAPWSVWAQGSRNVSHGCVNMSPAAARKMYQETLVGDVVETVGSWRQFKPGEGLDVWIFSWDEWKARSAVTQLASAGTASSKTSTSGSATSSATTSATSETSVAAATPSATGTASSSKR